MTKYLRIAVTAGLIAFLFIFVVDLDETVRVLASLDPLWLAITIGIITLDRLLMSAKWCLLLRARGHSLSFLKAIEIYCASMVWGAALPSTIGADAIRTTIMCRRGVPVHDVVASIVVERALGFVSALLWGLAALIALDRLLPRMAIYQDLLVSIILVLGAAVLFLIASLSEKLFQRSRKLVPARFREHKIVARFENLHLAYHDLGTSPRVIVIFSVLTLVQPMMVIAITWATARALSVDANIPVMLAAVPLAFIAARLPISLDGIGVFEGIFIAVMALAGIPTADALAVTLAGRVIQIATWLPWWVKYTLGAGSFSPPKQRRTERLAGEAAGP